MLRSRGKWSPVELKARNGVVIVSTGLRIVHIVLVTGAYGLIFLLNKYVFLEEAGKDSLIAVLMAQTSLH